MKVSLRIGYLNALILRPFYYRDIHIRQYGPDSLVRLVYPKPQGHMNRGVAESNHDGLWRLFFRVNLRDFVAHRFQQRSCLPKIGVVIDVDEHSQPNTSIFVSPILNCVVGKFGIWYQATDFVAILNNRVSHSHSANDSIRSTSIGTFATRDRNYVVCLYC